MAYLDKNDSQIKAARFGFMKKRWFKVVAILLAVLVIVGGIFVWKMDSVLNKISGGKGSIFKNIANSFPGAKNELVGESEGQVNIALLGMRGEHVVGGGLLADTIMVVSIRPKENKISMISVPRDLYVTVPGTQDQQKINAVHAYGEENGKKQGLSQMEKILSEVTGLNITYAASINFEGFKKLVDGVGGVNMHLDAPFSESLQFQGLEKRCDGVIYTVPSKDEKGVQKYETKKIQRKNGTYYANLKYYPLCRAKAISAESLECGGNFSLPAGDITLTGDQALCLVRSRVTSSDFERAKRQQIIMQSIKDKLLSAGTLTDFSKLNSILDNLGDNTRTNMEAWEMKQFYDLYMGMQNPQIYQRVLENSEEGLLYNPPQGAAGYILLPIGDNYDKIRDMAKNIFTMPAQTDIKPKI